MDVRKIVKPNVRSLRAYEAKEIPCRIKLDANESPFGLKVFRTVLANRYPDPEATVLRRLVARRLRVKAVNILHGNGSDELIYYLVATFGGPVLFPVPTFTMYGIIARALNEQPVGIPLDREFDLDIRQMLKAVRDKKPKITFLSSPNNPTGNSFSAEKILKLINASRGLVVVDEAYQPFSGTTSFVPLIKEHNNLVVLRTLSKVGLAGLRVGFMVADPSVVGEVNKVRLPFNVNALSQRIAADVLEDGKKLRFFEQAVVRERRRIYQEMKKMGGVYPYPSDANFILFRVKNAGRVFEGLLERGILVRDMKGVVNESLRVTVGSRKENDAFLKNLKQLV